MNQSPIVPLGAAARTGLVSAGIDVLRDWKRIADRPSEGRLGRMAMWRTHLRLKAGMLGNQGAGQARVLGFQVEHLGLGSLLHLYREIFISRVYDVALQGQRPTIIDCGSNIGMSILYFKALYPQATVIGFEPHPLVCGVLKNNLERNALESVTVHRKALGGSRGELSFFIQSDDPGALNMGLFADRHASRSITVEADLLSSYIDGDVDLLKLDIEGAEDMVLHELAAAGKLGRIRNIICEYHHHIDKTVDRLSHTLAVLEEAGFGYQLSAHSDRPAGRHVYQDVVIYAYQQGEQRPV